MKPLNVLRVRINKIRQDIGHWLPASLLFGAVSILMGWTVLKDWDKIVSFDWHLRLEYLILAAALHSFSICVIFGVWHHMMHHLGGFCNLRNNFHVYCLSILARRMPTPLWFVGSRLYFYRHYSVRGGIVLSITALEIALMILAGILCYASLLPAYVYIPRLSPWLLAIVVASIVVLFAVRPQIFIDLVNAVLHWRKRAGVAANISRRRLLLWSLTHLLSWYTGGLVVYATVKALMATPVGLPDSVGAAALAALVSMLGLLLPTGFGLREITLSVLLSGWIPPSAGIIVALSYRVIQTVVEMGWALVAYRLAGMGKADEVSTTGSTSDKGLDHPKEVLDLHPK